MATRINVGHREMVYHGLWRLETPFVKVLGHLIFFGYVAYMANFSHLAM